MDLQETIAEVVSSYLDQLADPGEVDSEDLAENIALRLQRLRPMVGALDWTPKAQDVETPTQDVVDEQAEKGCTHPPDEPCFGKPRRPVAEYNPPITADPEGWDPEDPYGDVAEYEREAGRHD